MADIKPPFADVPRRARRPPPRLVETVWAESVSGVDGTPPLPADRKTSRRPLKSLTNGPEAYAPVDEPTTEYFMSRQQSNNSADDRAVEPQGPAPIAVELPLEHQLPFFNFDVSPADVPLGGWSWAYLMCRWEDVRVCDLQEELGHLPQRPPRPLAKLAPPFYGQLAAEEKFSPRKRPASAYEGGTGSRPPLKVARPCLKQQHPPREKRAAPPREKGDPGGSSPGATPADVSHAFTLRGAQLTYAVLSGAKRVENRHFSMKPGWYALHTGSSTVSHESQYPLMAGVSGMPKEADLPHACIVGAVRISHALSLEQCEPTEPWAFGPVVNLISAVARLNQPVAHKGALSLWRMSDEARDEVRQQLASATIVTNDLSHLPPASEQPRSFQVRVKAQSQGYDQPAAASTLPPPPLTFSAFTTQLSQETA